MSFWKIFDVLGSVFKKDGPAPTQPIVEPDKKLPDKEDISLVTIPSRSETAATGSQFIQSNLNLTGSSREQNIINELINGNTPEFLRTLTPITVNSNNNTVIFYAMPDYICIGSDTDYVRIPMSPLSAQKVADAFGCVLPTRKMVNVIYKQAQIKLAALPWGPPYDASMHSTQRYGDHNKKIQNQFGHGGTQLVAGHKKDVVLTNYLAPNNPKKRVAIYGWFNADGTVIQGLNASSHDDAYADYSHGIRYISKKVQVNGVWKDISEVFKDSQLHSLLSDEGILNFLRY